MSRYNKLFLCSSREGQKEKEIFNQLNTAFDMIAMDPFCGIQVPKRLIPKVFITKYGIENLWKYNFLKNWRLMYFSCR
jgi:hypothetical protein